MGGSTVRECNKKCPQGQVWCDEKKCCPRGYSCVFGPTGWQCRRCNEDQVECGKKCCPKQTPRCCGAECCPKTLSCCSGTCADTKSDPRNCGSCGNVCESGVCGGGVCTLPSAMMVVTLIARLLLAAVFAVAAVTKLADREGTKKAVIAFGTPERLAAPLAILLPLAELAVAGLLLPATTAVYGAVGALVLLAVFSIAIAVSLARGRTPDCHCFGQLHSEPASWKTLVRNGALAVVAVVALAGSMAEPDASATAWIGDLSGAELLTLAVAVCAGALLVVGGFAFLTLMRSYGNVLVRLDSIEAALADSGIDLAGDRGASRVRARARYAGARLQRALARGRRGDARIADVSRPAGAPPFTSPHCGPCQSLLPTAAPGNANTATFSSSSSSPMGRDEVRAEAEEFELEHVLLDEDHALYGAFEASGTPSAVLVAPDGTIGSWVAAGSEWVERLVADATAGEPEPEGLPLGSEAPTVELPSLDGGAGVARRPPRTRRAAPLLEPRAVGSVARCTRACAPGRNRRTASRRSSSSYPQETPRARGQRGFGRSS